MEVAVRLGCEEAEQRGARRVAQTYETVGEVAPAAEQLCGQCGHGAGAHRCYPVAVEHGLQLSRSGVVEQDVASQRGLRSLYAVNHLYAEAVEAFGQQAGHRVEEIAALGVEADFGGQLGSGLEEEAFAHPFHACLGTDGQPLYVVV